MLAMHVVVEMPRFESDAKAAGLADAERMEIVDHVAADPTTGDRIPGTGGARKVRFAARGRGKSGGYRVITFYSGSDLPVFLITLFSKGEKLNLEQAERNAIRKRLATLAEEYRKGVMSHVSSR